MNLCHDIPGWSDERHHRFWSQLLQKEWADMLMVGVYHGRDICMICELARAQQDRPRYITGVDRFSDAPCDDWPVEARGKTWLEAGFGEAPTLDGARVNINRCCSDNVRVHLVQEDDEKFLGRVKPTYEVVYLDTSHDYETVLRQCRQLPNVLFPGGLACGDDYSDDAGWGVKKAVTEAFTKHEVHEGWIWSAKLEDLRA